MIAAYVLLQIGYALGLKGQPVLDLVVVSSGFVLRVVAGGAATGISISSMLLLVAAFGSLFMVAGKRYSELRHEATGPQTRESLEEYSESYLRFVWTLAATVTVLTYVLWAVTGATGGPGRVPWGVVSVAPFVLGMLRYAVEIDRGTAGAPEDVVLGDRPLQATGVLWLATVLPGVFA